MEEKLGDKVIVEDDYIKPGDFRDANVRKALEKKAKQEVKQKREQDGDSSDDDLRGAKEFIFHSKPIFS